jgi:hypothetical protein
MFAPPQARLVEPSLSPPAMTLQPAAPQVTDFPQRDYWGSGPRQGPERPGDRLNCEARAGGTRTRDARNGGSANRAMNYLNIVTLGHVVRGGECREKKGAPRSFSVVRGMRNDYV